MLKDLFRIPGTDAAIHSYGLLLVIGTLAAIWLAKSLARRRGMDPEIFVNAGLLALLSGVIGARLSHIIENWDHYTRAGLTFGQRLWEMVNISQGGLTYYGGFLLAFPVLVMYAIRKKVPVRVGMDIIAPALMVGLAFGRIGCLLNGCCFGAVCHSPIAISFPYYSDAYLEHVNEKLIEPPNVLLQENVRGEIRLVHPDHVAQDPRLVAAAAAERSLPVHATQIYSSITAFLLALLLLAFLPISRVPGHTFALLLMIEPITRFLLEMLRVEPVVRWGMSTSMLLAIPQFLLGVLLWVIFTRLSRDDANHRAAGHVAAAT